MNFKKISKVLLFPVVLLLTQVTFSQNKTVTGKVTDSKDSSAIAGASVLVKGSTAGTNTNAEGSFTLNVPTSVTTIIISAVGYTEQEVTITGGPVNVSLVAGGAGSNLNEVVVIGYGAVRKRDLTGSVSTITAKNFNQGVVASPDQLIQGKVSGLMITNNSGQPGSATTVKIRGNNSVRSGNNPLYVVDGVPLDGRTPRPSIDIGRGLNRTPEANPLIYINPNDIASVDILKDASATAIYGSRGANGVILITTKRGQGGAPKVEVNASAGISGIMKRIDVLSAEEYRTTIAKYNVKSDSGSSVDALDEITRTAVTQNYSLALSGGNENGRYRASFLASDQQGIVNNSGLKKYVGNLNGQYKFLDKRLSIDFGITATQYTEQIAPITDNAGSQGSLIAAALNWNPTYRLKNSSGLFNLTGGGGYNPLALVESFNDRNKSTVILGNISAAYKILSNLEYKFLIGINHGTAVRKVDWDGWFNFPGIAGQGLGVVTNGVLDSKTFTHTLNFNTDLSDDLSLNALAGYEYWTTDFSGSSTFAQGFATNLSQESRSSIPYTSILQSSTPSSTAIGSFEEPTVDLQSYFARAILNFRGKYLVTATIRADGSSKFGENNKYGYFPSVAAAWNISDEDFLKGNNIFNNLKLRIGWGKTGNQEFPAGASQEQYAFSSNTSLNLANVANPDLKWETTTATNIGLDFTILNNKIYGTLDFFKKNTTDVLFQLTAIQPAPSTQFFKNLPGNIINKGVELSLGSMIVQSKNFSWELNVNGTYLTNEFTNFPGPDVLTGSIDGQGVSDTYGQIISNNLPINAFWLKEFTGFDRDGNAIIAETPSYAGDPNPHYLLGISTTVAVKKFSFIVNARGAFGYKIYNNTATSVTNLGVITTGKNIGSFNLGSPQAVTDKVAASTRYLENGNFLKLGNATISYNLGNVGNYLKGANIYITGSNLFVLTDFQGFDPEVNTNKSNAGVPSLSIEYIPYPTPRSVTLGVNFSL